MPLSKANHFYSGSVHVVKYIYSRSSSLYSWMEGVVYVWIGEEVKEDKEVIYKDVLEKLAALGTVRDMVCLNGEPEYTNCMYIVCMEGVVYVWMND